VHSTGQNWLSPERIEVLRIEKKESVRNETEVVEVGG